MGNSQVKQVTSTKNEYYRRQVSSKHIEWSAIKGKRNPYSLYILLSVLPVAEKSAALV